jgi:hypothetical protein
MPVGALAGQGDCAQPVSEGADPTATDALAVLNGAVGLLACELCTCDVNNSGTVTATDALSVLQNAIGTGPPLVCPPGRKIVLLSQSAVVLSTQGEQSTIIAQVQSCNGSVDDFAVIDFASSNSDSVEVSSGGEVTALDDLGSAVITLSSDGLMPVAVTVIVAQPNGRALFIDDADVMSAMADQSEIVLRTNPTILDLEVGDVVISGDNGGIFVYILAIERQSHTVMIQGRLARLAEVFDELDLDLIGPSVPMTASLDGSSLRIHTDSGQFVQETLLERIECETNGSAVDVNFTGFSIVTAGLDRMNPRVRYVEHFDADAPGCPVFPTECVVVDEFALSIDAQASAVVTFGQLEIGGGLSAGVQCKVELGTYPIIPIPLLGGLSVAGSVTPDMTVTIGGSYNGASLTLNGPELDKSVELMVGFNYSADGGFATVGSGEPTFSGPGLTWGDATAEIQNDLDLTIEPALNVTPGISLLVGTEELLTFDLVRLSLFGGAGVTVNTPLNLLELDYVGPRWELYFGGLADLGALLENFEGVGEFLDSFGLKEEADQIFELDLKLFELKVTVLEGPEPTVSADVVGSTRSVDLTATAAGGLDNGAMVTFYAAEQAGGGGNFGSLEEIDSTTVQGGVATSNWEPDSGGTDVYQVSVRVESIFGDNLPYGPEQNAEVNLEGEITLEPETLTVSLDVGETSNETVALVSERLAADYEVVNTQPHVTIGNPQGSVEADGMIDLDLTVTCPQEAGNYPQSFDLLFTDRSVVHRPGWTTDRGGSAECAGCRFDL